MMALFSGFYLFFGCFFAPPGEKTTKQTKIKHRASAQHDNETD
jgi:hypothetical protein